MPAEATISLQNPETKRKLEQMKSPEESWDEFFDRVILDSTEQTRVSGTIRVGDRRVGFATHTTLPE